MDKAIFFYDGQCSFCNVTVQFLLDKTKLASLLFCTLQSEYAENFFAKHSYQQPDLSTAYLFLNGYLYQKSSAMLKAIAF
jgi:predicted DCC family thiol-disulfide oxidoreductase YuxK